MPAVRRADQRRALAGTARALARDIWRELRVPRCRYNESGAGQVRPRGSEEVASFFAGLEMIGPGLSSLTDWLPPGQAIPGLDGVSGRYAGVGRKPA